MAHRDIALMLTAGGCLLALAVFGRAGETAHDLSRARTDAIARDCGESVSASESSVRFAKLVIDPEFRSEGVAVADVNHDGRLDILAGNVWYEAPLWRPHVIAPLQTFDKAEGYSNSFLNFVIDVNGDGWVDQVVIGFPGREAVWRENPRGGPGPWRQHLISAVAGNESPAMTRLTLDGPPVLIFGVEDSTMVWLEPGTPVTDVWVRHAISEPNAPGARGHGLGVGDLNGDGLDDIVVRNGYWAAPAGPRNGPWPFVPADFGRGAAQMMVYDVNGDGKNDVISSSPHNIGVWWFEQRVTADGTTFVRHTIDESFSQSHALAAADINGDGLLDIVTGKRFWAHGPSGDVEPNAPAVLHWFELGRHRGCVTWTRHQIDDDSGVGTQVLAQDVDGDGLVDVVVANRKGVFLFLQQPRERE